MHDTGTCFHPPTSVSSTQRPHPCFDPAHPPPTSPYLCPASLQAFAMTGWRLGYLAAPQHFAKAAAAIQSQSTSGASSIAQQAALAALALGPRGGKPVAKMVAAFAERRDYVVSRLREIEGIKLAEPQVGRVEGHRVTAGC